MPLENYCKNCGHRIHQNDTHCRKCGCKTVYGPNDDIYMFTPPIHDIGFFNFDIDFSPYIISSRKDFKYDICSCGYLWDVNDKYCCMCGKERPKKKFLNILNRNNEEDTYFMDNVLCECGAVNSRENTFCEMCGKQLQEDDISSEGNFSNFNLDFDDSIFCFCGEENDKFSYFCRNCGMPLISYGKLSKPSILCTCSTLNDLASDFCIECGKYLKKEDSAIVCVCGEINTKGERYCQSCERPLNPQRLINTRIVCSCGHIVDYNSDFCPNCGKNLRQIINFKRSVKSLKDKFR